MARAFGGTDQISLGDITALDSGSTATFFAWIKPSSFVGIRPIFSKANTGQINWNMYIQSSKLNYQGSAAGAGEAAIVGATTLSLNTWYPVGVVRTGTSRRLFVNGAQDASDSSGTAFTNTTAAAMIGADAFGSSHFAGSIAEVALWNVALPDADMAALAAGAHPLRVYPFSLVGYWPLWGAHSPEIDASGRAQGGTVTGTSAADHARTGPYVAG